jgi:hypothetical protein
LIYKDLRALTNSPAGWQARKAAIIPAIARSDPQFFPQKTDFWKRFFALWQIKFIAHS